MKTITKLLTFSLLIGGLGLAAQAQDTNTDSHALTVNIPEVALLDLEADLGTSITLEATAPTEAGLGADVNDSDDTIWVNYSSIVNGTQDASRNVTVEISAGTVPGGTMITLQAAAYSGSSGDGTQGTAGSAVTLSSTAQDIITAIGSCYTGDGVSSGHQLTYTLALDSTDPDAYSKLDADDSNTLTVLYTLTDN